MGNNSDKKMLFEAMHKVTGMPLNEDMYTDDQVTQNFDKWHNPEQGPDQDTNVEDEGMSNEEFIAAMEKFQENDRETLKNMNPEESWYNFFVQQIEGRQKVIDVAKKEAGMPVNEDMRSPEEIQSSASSNLHDINKPAKMGVVDVQNAVSGYQAQQMEENNYRTLNDYLGEYIAGVTEEAHRIMGHGISENKN